MSRRKHKPSLAPKPAGLHAFRRGDFTTAIRQWSKPELESEPDVRPALAEAHFRRSLPPHQLFDDRLNDLQRAVDLCPAEARYWYHLALRQHEAGQLGEALAAYARASELGLNKPEAGFARGLAELERNPPTSLEALTWPAPEDRAALAPIAALLRGEPQAALDASPGNWLERLKSPGRGNESAQLWQGLAALMTGNLARALEALTLPKGQTLRSDAERVRLFYLGLATAAHGRPEAALQIWAEAAQGMARRGMAPLPRQNRAAAALYAERLHALHTAGKWEALYQLAQTALGQAPGAKLLINAQMIAANRLAQAAAQSGDWATATRYWREMRAALETTPGLGPLPPILRDLAIAHEAQEQWETAAETWAALLKCAPSGKRAPAPRKKASAARSPTVSLDASGQRAWLRRRVLDSYQRADRPDAAITYYKQAVKAAPDNLDLRLELATALLANQQVIAARNELHRLLERDPRHVGANVLLAEVQRARGDAAQAEAALRRALAIDPQHDTARQGLAKLLTERGTQQFNYGRYAQALQTYQEALPYQPNDPHLRVWLADTHLALRDEAAARTQLEAVLALRTPIAYALVFGCWIGGGREAEAREILARAEAAGLASPQFYAEAGISCLKRGAPPPSLPSFFGPPANAKRERGQAKLEKWGRELIEKALQDSAQQVTVLRVVITTLGLEQPALAAEYAQRLIHLTPDDPWAWMTLGLFQGLNHQAAAAKDALRKASALARKQGDPAMAREIDDLRQQISNPLFGLLGPMLQNFSPDLFEGFDEEDY